MSNAKNKRHVAAVIAWRNREMPSPVVVTSRSHETTVVAIGARTLFCKDGKTPRKRKGVIVSWRNVETTARATNVEIYSSIGERPDHVWTGPRLGKL